MPKTLSSLDTHYLVKELKQLENSRIDKIFSLGKEEIYFQLYVSNEGKKLLRVILGNGAFITKKKIVDDMPSHFCMVLRKHLDGKRLATVEQVQPERIIKLTFQSKEEERFVYIELFGKGNIILCDGDMIVDSLLRQKFKDRSILPKRDYSYPSMKYNLFDISKNKLSELLKGSNKNNVIVSLATELGLGGVYAEELCLLSNVDKALKPSDVKAKDVEVLHESLLKLQNKKFNPRIVYEDKSAVDVTPFSFGFYDEKDSKEYESFNDALQHYFTHEVQLVQEKKSPYEQQIGQLQRIVDEQKETISQMEVKEQENKEKGELLYQEYAVVKDILDQINEAQKKLSMKEIKEKLKGHKVVKDVDVKDKRITVEISK